MYSRAWVFSEGLAAVEKNGSLSFIDHSGRTVIDKKHEVHHRVGNYIFHGNYCKMVNPKDGNIGLIDKSGEWKLPAEHSDICWVDSLWFVKTTDGMEAVLDKYLNVVIPFSEMKLCFADGVILATTPDHTVRQYDLQGNLVTSNLIHHVEQMTYDTGELRYNTITPPDEEYNQDENNASYTPVNIQSTAKCRRYRAEYGWYGLMSPNGRIVTPPSYSSITAIAHDLYLCETANGYGIVLDGEGKIVL